MSEDLDNKEYRGKKNAVRAVKTTALHQIYMAAIFWLLSKLTPDSAKPDIKLPQLYNWKYLDSVLQNKGFSYE